MVTAKAAMTTTMMTTMTMQILPIIMMLTHGCRPARGGKRTQRNTTPKLIAIQFADIQNWGRC